MLKIGEEETHKRNKGCATFKLAASIEYEIQYEFFNDAHEGVVD